MNVMLMDSDTDNIKNFRTYIRSSFPDIRVVGSISDLSRDAAPLIKEWEPELIIADIRFFGGVRFTHFKEIHDEFPDLRFIVYGTYNESDYMKRAREFGVIDFMYRPVKPADLTRCLNQAAAHFKKADDVKTKSRALAQNYQDRLFLYEDIFLRGLLEGQITRESEIRGGFQYFGIPFGTGYSVLLFRIDHYRQIALTLPEKEKHLLIYKILTIIQEQMHDEQSQAIVRSFNEVAVLLGGQYTVENKVLLCDGIKHAIFEQADTRVTVGIGRTYDDVQEIAVSFREAAAAFRYRYRLGFHAVIPIEYVEPDNRITHRYPVEREERLVHAAVVGDYEYCKQAINEIFMAMAQGGAPPENLVAKIVMTVVFSINRYISEQNLPIAQQAMRFFPVADILAIANLEDGVKFLESSLKQFCAFIGQSNDIEAGRLHASARRYVQKHYAENFSAAKTAAALYTTPENLNRVFMEKEGEPLFDYVMRARVNAARALLAETEQDEEAIAVKVGFDDVKYFRSIFRKYHGEGPGEYRAKAGAEAKGNI